MAGRHRAQRKRQWGRALLTPVVVAFAVAAVVLGALADDARILRGAVYGAAALVLLGLLVRARRPAEPRGDLHRLRSEVAILRGQLDAVNAAMDTLTAAITALAAPERPTTLQLPLIRAAFAVPPQSASHTNGHTNGHANGAGRVIDLTTPAAVEH